MVTGLGVKFRTPIVTEPYKFSWFEVELPDPSPNEVIFRNKACLICGSDIHAYKGLHPFSPLPACLGHEVAAEVVEVGSRVSSLEIGDRVYVGSVGASPIPCGQCVNCLRGEPQTCLRQKITTTFKIGGKNVSRFPSGFGEYSIGHEGVAYKIPDGVSVFEAAVTTDLAYVLGVVKRSGAGIGNSAAILGAGPIGLRVLEIARLSGVSPIIVSEPVENRAACARDLGADHVVNPLAEDPVKGVLKLTGGEGVDFVYDTSGSAAVTEQGLKMLRTSIGGAGTLIAMGLYEHPEFSLNMSELMHKAGKIVTEWGIRTERRINIETALSLMQHKKLNILRWITHKLPENEIDEAMMKLIEKRDNAIGIEIIH